MNCPRCGQQIDVQMPRLGEVWLRVDNGHLYRVTKEPYPGLEAYATAERTRPQSQGCDVSFMNAMWPSDVSRGQWIRVMNPSDEDLAPPKRSTGA